MTPLLIIRIAMLSGVLAFGAMTWFLQQRDGAPAAIPEASQQTLLWMGRGLWALVIVGCVLVYQVMGRSDTAKVRQLSIVAWAMGEALALFGGVVWFVSGSPSWYIPGLTFLVLTFVVFKPEGARG